MAFKYAYAIVSGLPKSFTEHTGNRLNQKFNMEEAIAEREYFVETLRRIQIDVLELGAEERHPECIKVDDSAVVINGTAVMCNPYGSQRKGEVNLIRQTLKNELGCKIVELSTDGAQVEGSDVLFTGQEIIVGITNHTNESGASAIARAFPEYATTIVRVPPSFRSLKDGVNVAGINVLAVGESDAAKQLLKEIGCVVSYKYKVITLPEEHAANCLYVNNYLLHGSSEMIPKSFEVFDNKIDYNRHAVHMPHLANAGVPISKLALFVNRFRRQRNLISTIP